MYRNRIGCFNNCRKKRKANVEENSGFVSFKDNFSPLHSFLFILYFYFIIITYSICVSSCISSKSNFIIPRRFIIPQPDGLLLANTELKVLLGYFYLILISFIIKRAFLNPSYKSNLLTKLRIKRPLFSNKNSRLVNIANALCLWILLVNFLLIAVSNPSLKNPGPQGDYSVFYCNVQGLIPFGELAVENPMLNFTKIHELNHLLSVQKPDIVIYNETWLKNNVLDSEVLPTNIYKVFRLDRSAYTHPPDPNNSRKFRRNGGGVLIGIKHDLDIESKETPIKCKAEILSIELTDKIGRKSIISSLYRVGTLGFENHNRVSQYLHTIRKRRRVQSLTLIGDLNLPSARWIENFSSIPLEQTFIDTFNDLSLSQLVTIPTHYKGNILDNILTDKPELISGLTVDSSQKPCGSDHYPIFFKLKLNAKRKRPCKRKIYNFKQADWSNLNRELASINWDDLLSGHSVEESWLFFKEKLTSSCNMHIPKISICDEFQPPWFDSEVFDLCRKKERLHKEWKESSKDEKYFKFSKARKDFKNLIDAKMNANFDDPLNRNLISKKFWSYVKSKSNSHRIPELVSYENCMRSDPQGQCDLFNKFFQDQFTGESEYSIDIDYSNDHLFQVAFEATHIQKLLQNLDPNKAQGADNIHEKFLKIARPVSLGPCLYCSTFHSLLGVSQQIGK